MSKEQKQARVGDFEENIKTLNGLVKENFQLGIETYVALVEETQKFANAQFDEAFALENDYIEQVKGTYDKVFKDVPGLNYAENLDKVLDTQKKYAKYVRNTSEKLTKNGVDLVQKAAESYFASLEGIYKSFNLS